MKNHIKVTITLPKELNSIVEQLVTESKKTPKPITKSSLIAVALWEYLHEANKMLKAINSKEEN